MRKSKEAVIVNRFIYASFSFYPQVWHFSTCELIRKIEKIQKRCLRKVLHDFESHYDILLRKSEQITKEIKRLRILAIEVVKKVNNFNPSYYLKDILKDELNNILQMQCANIIIESP